MNDLGIILFYKLKMKFREIKSIIKNLLMGLIIIGVVLVFTVFQLGKIIIGNLELINLYNNRIVLGISIITVILTLFSKRIPLEWHPASMIHLSGAKFKTVFKISLLKETIIHIILSTFTALVLNSFRINWETIKIFLSLWNLFMISLISRYFIYNKGFNIKIVSFILIYTIVLNFQLYVNKYLSIILILYLTYMSISCIRSALNIHFDFDKSFTDMVFINRANYMARGNIIEDKQEFVRETSSEKNRDNIILKKLKFKNPLVQKNLVTFSRINVTVSIYIFAISIITVVLYRLEIFEFVKTIKELGLGTTIVVFHQALFINNILILITEQKKLLVAKSKKGLYLPYKKYEIIESFMVLGVPLLSIVTLIVGIILGKSLWIIVLSSLLYSIVLLISLYFVPNRLKFFEHFIYFLILGVSYLFIEFT